MKPEQSPAQATAPRPVAERRIFAQAELHRTIRPRSLPSHLPFASDQASLSSGFLVLPALLGQHSHPFAPTFSPGDHYPAGFQLMSEPRRSQRRTGEEQARPLGVQGKGGFQQGTAWSGWLGPRMRGWTQPPVL